MAVPFIDPSSVASEAPGAVGDGPRPTGLAAFRVIAPRRRLLRPLGLLALCVLPLLGCGEDGGECDRCEVDADCQMDLVCVNFRDEDGNLVGTRCGSGTGGTQCRVR